MSEKSRFHRVSQVIRNRKVLSHWAEEPAYCSICIVSLGPNIYLHMLGRTHYSSSYSWRLKPVALAKTFCASMSDAIFTAVVKINCLVKTAFVDKRVLRSLSPGPIYSVGHCQFRFFDQSLLIPELLVKVWRESRSPDVCHMRSGCWPLWLFTVSYLSSFCRGLDCLCSTTQ